MRLRLGERGASAKMPGDWDWDRIRRNTERHRRYQEWHQENLRRSALHRWLNKHDPERVGVGIVLISVSMLLLFGAAAMLSALLYSALKWLE